MLRRLIAFSIACICIVSSIHVSFAENEYLFCDFEETADKYTVLSLKPQDGVAAIENGVLKIACLSGKSPEVHFIINKGYKAIDDVEVIEFDYMSEASSVNIYLQNTPLSGSIFRLKQTSETTMRATYGESATATTNVNKDIKTDIRSGQWYHIQLILDYPNKRCSVAIDGETVVSNAALFYNAVGYTNAFYDILIGPDKAGTIYVDNLAVYPYDNTDILMKVRSELISVPKIATEDIFLTEDLPDDISVTWSSSDENVIENYGGVHFPAMSEGDKEVELSATLSKGDDKYTRTYNVLVPAKLTDSEAIALAIDNVSVQEKIYDEYSLPAVGENDVKISWTADDASAISIADQETDGSYAVTTLRQNEDRPVVLTAVFERNGVKEEKKYSTIVVRFMTDQLCADEDVQNIILPAKTAESFELPYAGENSTNITWSSKDTDYIIIEDGKATVIARGTTDRNVTLTAKVTKGEAYAEKDFVVILEKDIDGNTALLREAVEALVLDNTTSLTRNITLPSEGINGTKISWKSSDSSVISANGVINRASYTQSANLTATVVKDTLTMQKTFRITVAGSSSASSGGGGGGSSVKPTKSVSFGIGGGSGVPTAVPLQTAAPVQTSEPQMPEQDAGTTFADVLPTHWAYSYIEKLAQENVVDGDEAGNFNPEKTVTREEFVKMLIQSLYDDADYEKVNDFSDVVTTEWYAKHIYSAYEKGFITGIDDHSFGIGKPILREQIAAILFRVIGAEGVQEISFIDKDDISDYAIPAVGALSKAGFIAGDENGSFRPKAAATRAETAKLICELVDYLNEVQ